MLNGFLFSAHTLAHRVSQSIYGVFYNFR